MAVSWLVLFGPYNRTFEKKSHHHILLYSSAGYKLATYEPCSLGPRRLFRYALYWTVLFGFMWNCHYFWGFEIYGSELASFI